MRILFGQIGVKGFIKEFSEISISPGWNANLDSSKDTPSDLVLNINNEWVGAYQLDGTKETYDKAIDNYTEILRKLLEKGYCAESDFINFEWYDAMWE